MSMRLDMDLSGTSGAGAPAAPSFRKSLLIVDDDRLAVSRLVSIETRPRLLPVAPHRVETIADGIQRRVLFRASALLAHASFIRCHRSYLINLSEVEDVNDTTVLLTNGDRVLLNSKNAAALRRRIADHLWQEMEMRHG